jgi:hypothetical protein
MSDGDRLYKKIAKVSVWRETMPAPTQFVTQQLVPGEQLDLNAVRIKFKIRKTLTKTPNQGDVYLYNLAESTRSDLETLPLVVQVEAGYDGVARLLFLGDLHFGMSEEKGPTWETLLQCGDGLRKHAHARCNRSYKAGTSIRQVLSDAVATMGFTLPKNLANDSALDQPFRNGTVSYGPTRDELTRLLAAQGYHWSVQNGQLRVLKDDEVSNLGALPIDKQHGMIGSPRYGSPPKSGKPPHVRVKMELYPELTPGDLVIVTAKGFNHGKAGKFRLESVEHNGDTHSTDWTTEVELKPY